MSALISTISKYLGVHISDGNTKLGAIPSLSFPPIQSCANFIRCGLWCYAMKAFKQYPEVRTAWMHNLWIWQTHRQAFKNQVWSWLEKEKPKKFRWLVGGDIPDVYFLEFIFDTAKKFKGTTFLVFTKRVDVLSDFNDYKFFYMPKNLRLRISRWPSDKDHWTSTIVRQMAMPSRSTLPQAWLRDPKEPDNRIPDDAYSCKGSCTECTFCFRASTRDVVFDKH